MRIFNHSTGSDTGGVSIAIKQAFDRLAPDWTYREMVASLNYIDYPVDLPWSQVEMERQYDAADVVHISNTLHAHDWYDNGQGKPTVFTHHGWLWQDYPARVAEVRKVGCVQIGSTLDLELMQPADVEWVPRPIDLADLRAIRAEHYRESEVIRVGHAPTNRPIKGSDAFDAAIRAMRESGLNVEPVVIEGVSWRECLRRKATVDIYFDQPTLGYGTNALESWAQGVPVVCGIADPVIREGFRDYFGVMPFAEASEATLETVLRALVADLGLRNEYARRGTAHVERWHSGAETVERLRRIYASAGPTTPGGSGKRLSAASLAKIARHEARDRRRERVAV